MPNKTALWPMMQIAPSMAVVIAIIGVPAGTLVWQSFFTSRFGLDVYQQLFEDGYTLAVLARTLWLAASVTLISLVIAYPYAYAMTVARRPIAQILLAIAVLTFWTSVVARSFAWIVLLERGGLIVRFFEAAGLAPPEMLHTLSSALIGMVHVMLPYMILTLYTNFREIDRNLMTAAETLGASPLSAFLRIFVPLSMPGVIAGATLVSVVSLGFYITPAMLGTPRQALVAQLLDVQISRLLDFKAAGATSLILLLLILLLFCLLRLLAFVWKYRSESKLGTAS